MREGFRPVPDAIAKYRNRKNARDTVEAARLAAIAKEDSHDSRDPRADRRALERKAEEKNVEPGSVVDKTVEIPPESEYKNPEIENLKIDVISGETDDKASSRFRSERADLASERRRSAEIAQRKRAEELSRAIREGFGM